jgi:hypothetical protein
MMKTRGNGTYTTVATQGTPGYLSPYDPMCPPSQRYMAVHRVDGGGWGIIDRRTARLLAEARPDQHRYSSWQEVRAVVGAMNEMAG